MLLERAGGLATKIQAFRKLEAAAREAALVTTRVGQVRDAAQALGRARATLAKFTQAGVPVQFVPVNSSTLKERASLLRATAADNPVALADPPFNFSHDFSDRLKGIANAAQQAADAAWRGFVESKSLGGSEEVLGTLNQLPQMRAGVAKIRQCRQSVNALATSIPSDMASAIKTIDDLETKHKSAWAELTSDGIPLSVLEFLRQCASAGAPLTSLNDEVRDWLGVKHLLESFRIRIG